MSGVRYDFVELAYGRHAGRVEFDEVDAPFLIVGSNGTGKSTIIEALVRSLYGFRRLRREERRGHRRRRPWTGAQYRAMVGLSGPEGSLTFDRDFESDEVVVRRVGEEPPLFEGEANLARAGETSRRYRDVLRRQFGLGDLDAYERTGCIQQGGLIRTELSEDLLRVAAGGHADVESAQRRLRREYHDLTLEPLAEGEARRRKLGRLERLQEQVTELETRARDARAAEERRAPLARERDRLKGEIAGTQTEIEELEAAFESVSELETLRTAEEASQGSVRQLESAGHELDEAMARFDLLQTRDLGQEDRVYPDDFLGRIAALEKGLWPRRDRLDATLGNLRGRLADVAAPGREAHMRLLAPAAAAVIGVWLLAQSMTLPGGLLLLLGVATGAALWARVHGLAAERARLADELHRADEESRDLEDRIEALLSDVPDGDSLTPDTVPRRRREFERQMAELRQLADAERSLRNAMDRANRVLEAETTAKSEVDAEEDATDRDPVRDVRRTGGATGLVDRGRHLLKDIQRAVSNERDERLAPLKVRLLEASRRSFSLPAGVDATGAAVRAALQELRARNGELQEELAGAERRIAYEGRPGQSALALEREIEQLREQLEAVGRRAAAYREASALITHAYEAFRSTDQERLLSAISRHLAEISNGELGPLETEEGLETARVRAGDRSLPLASPPLSYGQLHMTLLAVRLGAADFLAGLGVRLPLLLDDPFVHLDAGRARELWQVLANIATERQVIVATQDRLLIDHLAVEPDLDLDASHEVADEVDPGENAPQDMASENGSKTGPGGTGARRTKARPAGARRDPAKTAPTDTEAASAADPDLWSALGIIDEEES
jgi:DNA repair exonuclease SbcCD ATPase subunit